MGLEILGAGRNPASVMLDVVTSRGEAWRKSRARDRLRLFRDEYHELLRQLVQRVFHHPVVQSGMLDLVELVGGTSFMKRIADELARPLYSRMPLRRVVLPGEVFEFDATQPTPFQPITVTQLAWNALARESAWQATMGLVAALLVAVNDVAVLTRYVDGVGMTLDVLTPDIFSVKPHPSVKTKALAIAYETQWDETGNCVLWTVWDDKITFQMNAGGNVVGVVSAHNFGRIPAGFFHRREPWCSFFDTSSGEDIVSQAKQSMFLDLIVQRKIKNQSHRQAVFTGEADGFPKNQVMDEQSVMMINGTGSLTIADLESDPTKLISTKLDNEAGVASNYGISRDRLNQKVVEIGDDEALKERCTELSTRMVLGELDTFEALKTVSREHPTWKLPVEAALMIDLSQLNIRVDRKTQLEIRKEEKSQGGRSAVDDVLEDNPEFGGDRRRAAAYLAEKMAEQAVIVQKQRELNVSPDATTEEPGQSPAKNGALGPQVRDGKITKDQAAAQAKTGDPEARRARLLKIAKG